MSNKTSDNNVATEEDIKVLKNIEKLRRIEFKHCVTDREERAIANILSDYTRQKQINEEHKKLNDELREREKELEEESKENKKKYLALLIGQFPDTTGTYKKYKEELQELLEGDENSGNFKS